MKHRTNVLLVAATLTASPALAQVLDDFDAYPNQASFEAAWDVLVDAVAEAELSTGFARSGNAMRLSGPFSGFLGGGTVRLDLGAPQDWSERGTFELWFAGGGANGEATSAEGFQVALRGASGETVLSGPQINAATTANQWTRYTVDLTAAAVSDVRFVDLNIVAEDGATGVLYIDDVTIGAERLVIDASTESHELLGFGAQVWPDDDLGEMVISVMDFRYVRMAVGPNWDNFTPAVPTEADAEQMFQFVSQNFNGDFSFRLTQALSAFEEMDRLGVEVILNQFKIPDPWLDDNDRLRESNLDEYAHYWTAVVRLMDENGYRPEYIELANEPDGPWNGVITPTRYDLLVPLVRQSLDNAGFAEIGIVGPGLSVMGRGAEWVDEMGPDAIRDLAAWSTHTWDDFRGLDPMWASFGGAVDRADPDQTKPIFLTEYATSRGLFNGVQYDRNEGIGRSDNPASESSQYAVQVFENTVDLLNRNVGAFVYWEAADQFWNDGQWGLHRLSGDGWRPVADTLFMLNSTSPPGSIVAEPLWDDDALKAAALTTPSGSLVLAISNMSDQAVERTIAVPSHTLLNVLEAWRFDAFNLANIRNSIQIEPDSCFDLTVPAEGCVVVELAADPARGCPADLADPAGVLDLADINAFTGAFIAQDPLADLAPPPGVYDLGDISAFIGSILAGCP